MKGVVQVDRSGIGTGLVDLTHIKNICNGRVVGASNRSRNEVAAMGGKSCSALLGVAACPGEKSTDET
jgi:hypothetical protein